MQSKIKVVLKSEVERWLGHPIIFSHQCACYSKDNVKLQISFEHHSSGRGGGGLTKNMI